jgi:Tol biopolymer transport system component
MHPAFFYKRSQTSIRYVLLLSLLATPLLWNTAKAGEAPSKGNQPEPHLANIRQLTFAGKNAEAYFSAESNRLVYQSTLEPDGKTLRSCYQIYIMDLDGTNVRRVSLGLGGTTCGYFFPGGRRVLFSSTHIDSQFCPPIPEKTERYRWPLDNYDIFTMNIGGRDLQRLTSAQGYDAEATISPDGKSIVFTSMRDGDLDVYSMNIDGTNVNRLTQEIGYDGGAFFSPDNKRIVYRAHHPKTDEDPKAYRDLLAQNLVEPSSLEIFVMNADGSNKTQVTHNGRSNFAPFFLPDGKRIIYSSNLSTPADHRGRPSFHLHIIKEDGTQSEQITFNGHFNSFPMFSPDGKQVVWSSDRNAANPKEFNIFLADWVP